MIEPSLQKLTEEIFTDTLETEEILANSAPMKKLKRGHRQAELRKGRFVELVKVGSSGGVT
jgi:hypothetical protein